MLTNPELADDLRQLEAILAEADALVANLDDEAFRWRPEAGKWSISECFEHLSVTVEKYAPNLEKCIREGRQWGKTGAGEPKRGWVMGWMIRSLEPPVTRRFSAPKAFQPQQARPQREVYPRFQKLHRDLAATMADADGLDLAKNRLASPITSLLRMSLGEAFALMLSHARRHVWQARQIRQAPGFPGASAAASRT